MSSTYSFGINSAKYCFVLLQSIFFYCYYYFIKQRFIFSFTVLEFFNLCWQSVKTLQYLASAPFSSSKFSYWTLSMGTTLWLLCVNETQSGQTRWSQVLQNRHVIFFWCPSHLILSRITLSSTSGAFKSTIWCCELVCTLLWICFTFLTQNCITLNAPPF